MRPSTEYINMILPYISNSMSKMSNEKQAKIHKIFDEIYDNIRMADKISFVEREKTILTHHIEQINSISEIPKSSFNNTMYFPKKIKDYVDDNALYKITYVFHLNKTKYIIYFIRLPLF